MHGRELSIEGSEFGCVALRLTVGKIVMMNSLYQVLTEDDMT